MAKKAWISFPLITSGDASDASVVTFLKGGLKKELEVETAAFVTKWLMDKDVPFKVDFDSAAVDRNLVLEALPRRLQRVLGYKVSSATEATDGSQVEQVAAVEEAGGAAQVAEVKPAVVVEPVAEVKEAGPAEQVAEVEQVAAVEETGAERPGGDEGMEGSSELR